MSKVILDAAHFDAQARRWEENPVFRERAERIAAAVRARIPLNKAMTALDYGSGTGMLAFLLKDGLGHITLMDSSAGMLAVAAEKMAAQRVTNMTLCQVDLCADPPADKIYDLILSAMTLHHIRDTAHILQVFHRLLNPGGWLAVADLDREDGSFHGLEVDVHHGFERDALAALARTAGFDDIAFDTVFEIEKDREGVVRRYPVFLMTARRPRETLKKAASGIAPRASNRLKTIKQIGEVAEHRAGERHSRVAIFSVSLRKPTKQLIRPNDWLSCVMF